MSLNKVSNAMPPIFGATGFTGVFLDLLPNIGTIVQTCILATIGAVVGGVVGYLVKVLIERIAHNIKK